jgi:hypothetical protein
VRPAQAPVVPPEIERALAGAVDLAAELVAAGAGDVDGVAAALYRRWYLGAGTRGDGPVRESDRDMVEMLRAAHADTARWSADWRAARVSTRGRVVAARGNERRLLDPIDYLNPVAPGLTPAPGGPVTVTERRDSTMLQAGYWITNNAAWQRAGGSSPLLRLYWNVAAHEAPALVRALTGRLVSLDTPHSLKCPVVASLYDRADAAVLFVPRDAFAPLAPELRAAHEALRLEPARATPPLARRLAPGLALAEDPPGEESFGLKRCRLIAEALVASPGLRPGAEALGVIFDRLRAAGVPPERPHLEGADSADYPW